MKEAKEIGNYYGSLIVEEYDSKYYWQIENYDSLFYEDGKIIKDEWEEIPKELYDVICKYGNLMDYNG